MVRGAPPLPQCLGHRGKMDKWDAGETAFLLKKVPEELPIFIALQGPLSLSADEVR